MKWSYWKYKKDDVIIEIENINKVLSKINYILEAYYMNLKELNAKSRFSDEYSYITSK